MGLFDRFRKKKDDNINPDGTMINYTYRNTLNDYTRLAIETMGTSGITGLDEDQLTEKLLYFYDNMVRVPERIKILMETFGIDEETAKQVEYVSFAKTSLIGDYYLYKENGATKFYIRDKNKKLKYNLNIKDFTKYVGFMINNDGVPVFNIEEIPKKRYDDVLNQKTEYSTTKSVETTHKDEFKPMNEEEFIKKYSRPILREASSPELENLMNEEERLLDKLSNKNYYGSEESKIEFKALNEAISNYIENNPEDYIIKGAKDIGLRLEFTKRVPDDELNIIELYGKGLYYEDLEEYQEAIEIYKEVDRLNKIVLKDKLAELEALHGKRDYLYSAKAKDRIRICENKINRAKIKELEAEAKALEETNPAEAIKKYEELNILNPNLKKYNKRIYRMMELEAKALEETDPIEAINKYEELNILNPNLKKYDKRIEIIKRKLNK